MGKKSKAKKIIREMLKEKEAKEAKKKHKETEKTLAQQSKKPHLKINKKKLFGSVLAIIMLAILASTGYLLFQKAFRAQPIAKLLPEDSTIAIVEINTNFDHNQLIKTFNLLKNYPQYSKQKVIETAEKWLTVSYENDLKPWLGRQIGVALVNARKEKGTVYELYFAEFISKTNVEKFLAKYNPVKNIYTGKETYMVSVPKVGASYITFINNYLFFSNNEQAIYELLDSQNSSDKVYTSQKYRKIDNNLPLNRTAFIYMDFDDIDDGFFKHFPVLSESGLSAQILQPFLKTFDAEGAILTAMDNNFLVQSFLNLDPEVSENSQYLSLHKKYNASLTKYISKDTLAFWGGEELEYQLKKFMELLSGGSSENLTLSDRIFESYTEKYFGKDISFKDDILPFFKREFIVAFEKINGENSYKLLFELDSPQSDAIKIHQLASNFASIGAVFEPKVVEHTLKDGTVGKEIIAVPEEIIKTETNYEDTIIYELKMGKQKWGIYYTILDNIAVVGNNIDAIKSSISLSKDPKSSLFLSKLFINNIEPVLNSSDEVSYFNFDGILPLVFKEKPAPAFLNIIDSLSSGRNYFNDGMVTINYIHIK